MKQRLLFLFLFTTLFFSNIPPAYAADGFYVGGQVGHVGLTNDLSRAFLNANNAIGFGIDLGMRSNSVLDVIFSSQYSSHSGTAGLSIMSEVLSAKVHFLQFNDFDFTANAGPGFYFLKALGATDSKFGIQFGAGVDVLADEHIRVGLGWNWHSLFSGSDYWTAMMRFGYQFGD